MAVVDYWWADVYTGGGWITNTCSLKFGRHLSVTAQAAISSLGGWDAFGRGEGMVYVAITGYVRNGQYVPVGWSPLFISGDLGCSQLDVSARAWDGWVHGGAFVYVWD